MNTSLLTHRRNQYSYFTTKKYIPRAWAGIEAFFRRYVGSLNIVKAKVPITNAEVDTLYRGLLALEKVNEAVEVSVGLTEALRAYRYTLITQKSTAAVPAPDVAPLAALVAALNNAPGGLLFEEDGLTDKMVRSGKCTQADFDQLGVVYGKTHVVDPEMAVGKLYARFTGGYVDLHWTLPHGYELARVTRSSNHGPWHEVVTTDRNAWTDMSAIPDLAEVRAYRLEIMEGDRGIGKPAVVKIIVGKDVVVDESTEE